MMGRLEVHRFFMSVSEEKSSLDKMAMKERKKIKEKIRNKK
jgi:hypothetical protein